LSLAWLARSRYNDGMATLVTLQGPNPGRNFRLADGPSLVGRQPNAAVHLDSLAVSRQHARIVADDNAFFVEDLGSSNGTYLNGRPIEGRTPLTEHDTLQIGPYVLALRPDPPPPKAEPDQVIRSRVSASASNHTLFLHNPQYKLQVVLEIAQTLARTLELDPLLGKLLDHLLRLFPQAGRGLVLLCEHDRLIVRAVRGRHGNAGDSAPYSRTVVNRALDEGVGILSQDVTGDPKLVLSQTLMSLNLRSFLCVPMIAPADGRRLGVIQLDCTTGGLAFREEDLEVLTAVALQVTVVLENAALHAARLEEERLHQELAVASEIQQGYLPTDFAPLGEAGFELYARVHPAREVSGDLYDFFALDDGRLAFFVGDVSGKGMPAALYMVAVRTLARHLATSGASPAQTLTRLNDALAADNPSGMFVTLVYGIYDPRTGGVVLASGGHPKPLLRRADGRVEEVPVTNGRLLGYSVGKVGLSDCALTLAPGETLVIYTDGFTEARPGGGAMFGPGRLGEALGARTGLPLEKCAEEVKAAVDRYTGSPELQDDLTLLMLRRR
jgi:sigma-B regulation protein RsbU (phosphoserine phosphatase)